MKKSKLKQIIREEYQNVTGNLLTEENIVDKIISLILKPKINKEVEKIKNTPEYIELEREAKLAIKNLEAMSKRLERIADEQSELEKKAKSVKVTGYRKGMNFYELKALFNPIYKKLAKHNI